MGGLLHLVQRGWAWAGWGRPSPLLAVPNVTAHPSTASVPITVLLYDGPLLCSFNLAIKGLKFTLNYNTHTDRNLFIVRTDCFKCSTVWSVNKFVVNEQLMWICDARSLQCSLNLSVQQQDRDDVNTSFIMVSFTTHCRTTDELSLLIIPFFRPF